MSLAHYAQWSPCGLGSADVESLTSALRRLAHTEARTVGELLGAYVVEPHRRERGHRYPIVQVTRVTEAINGAQPATRLIVERLCRAGVPMLERTTLLDRAPGIETREAFRSLRAWCPRCLDDDGDDAYDRLAWSFAATLTCARHRLPLLSACPQCGRGHRAWHARANPWSCPHCDAVLFDSDATSLPHAPDDPEGDQVRALLAFVEGGGIATPAMVGGGFAALAARFGGLHRLATRLGHSVSGLSTICAGRTRPHLGLLRTCPLSWTVRRLRRCPPRGTSLRTRSGSGTRGPNGVGARCTRPRGSGRSSPARRRA